MSPGRLFIVSEDSFRLVEVAGDDPTSRNRDGVAFPLSLTAARALVAYNVLTAAYR
ncbi:MAG TPA: hypothetical protein VEW66_00615 [Thermomicrobiales bacterium]|nr:hypothetical protein [Thermomicrobiales bacterium]